ncbi:hypothetical protein HRI_005185900 [Hibiscus trionum]|uniref:FHA domain-containing protein n=1 Tax=Hibiscus trionum TaxID=183268 RepID=A0A9W7JKS5_HIBTR|nr:hypothetical protein HRI_005185900 [Hibiscus trionum]
MAEEKGRKIPVFTVVKNGAILKNIFVIEKPRVMEDEEDPHNQESETEEILIVGRHPDCNIMLTHPSISRFHLQIHSRPSSQKLSVIDLSSVHGTWVSGKKIDSGVAVELKEGDTIKLGGSTRVYKLHWIPMSRAYDMENPFVSSMDMGVEEEKEEESAVESHLGVNTLSTERGCGEEKDSLMVEEETSESSVPATEKEVFSMDWMLEGLVSLFCDGSSGLVMNTEIPPAPPLPENMNPSTYDTENSLEKRELSFLKELELETYSATVSVTVEENRQKMDVSRVSTQPHLMESNKSTLQAEDIVLKILESQQVHEEDQIPQPLSALKPREESENAAADGCKHYISGKIEDADDAKLSSKVYGIQHTSFYSVSLRTESVNSSLPIAEDDKRNPTPHSLLAPAVLSESENLDGSPLRLETKSNFQSIWSRRGKPDSVLQIQTGKSGADENKAIPKSLFVSSEDEEIFTPDKENFTPTTILMKALKRKGKLEETKHSSSKVTFSSHLQREDDMITSDKENQTPKLIKEHKSTRKASRNQPKLEQEMVIKGKAVRVPIQFLSVDSACETVSEALVPNTSVRSCKSTTLNTKKMEKRIGYPSLNKSVGEQRRTWTMVADTSSLMDKESRKLLKLLQGLKGTLLVIPRMVIRELDCLKRRGTLFRRKNEASSVLEWIEECLVKTKWWIHVQSTMEEGWPIAPTPPATPYSHFSQDSVFGPFSARESLMEIATPTAQDHILDYALLCRKMRSGDGQLVLLSNDVTLKIKAMAEGLICETVQEFRESLVNPFSKRFMWADSSPRGHTWSVMDDVVLRDKYNRCPLKKPSKGDIKGLKLILLHNSHYGQISSIR